MRINSKNDDFDKRIGKQNNTRVGIIITLFLSGICAASFIINAGLFPVNMVYVEAEDQNGIPLQFQMFPGIFSDEVLASEGNDSFAQNQSNDVIKQTSDVTSNQTKNAVNGSIVTLPPLNELEDRRH
jgi:hypothetical protein